jgi:citronellol/citronellal dehydrogenase
MGWPSRNAEAKTQERDSIKPFNGFHRAVKPKIF